jgi:GntR family transcriptional regulator
MLIDRTSPVPLYYQLKQILLSKIQANEWAAGMVIPSELELQETYGLSRTTVRQTLADLVTEGLLIRERGRGTFIAKPKITFNPSTALELNEYLSQQGVALGWRLLSTEWETATTPIAAALKIAPQSRVFVLRRLRLAGNDPLGYHFAYVPEALAAQVQRERLHEGSSLDYLQNVPTLEDRHIERTLEACLAGETERELLGLREGAAVLAMERIVYGNDGVPVEYLRAAFRGDRFKYRIMV